MLARLLKRAQKLMVEIVIDSACRFLLYAALGALSGHEVHWDMYIGGWGNTR
jgi:hypothetical protein